ncbi:hypothetical protein BX265_5403 [Streptomyces sp. TLI_235]|nr:hypothetical protein BX265_5403 [Streptomyces sp. TLI_235]
MRKFLIVLLGAAAAAVFVQSLPDIKRYLKIRQM